MFYPSRVYSGSKKRGKDWIPETITGMVMVNPRYKVNNLLPNTKAIVDSSAFQDIDRDIRLSPKEALDRQIKYREYLQKIAGNDFNFEAISIYDCMLGVDELVVNGKKVKVRGTEESSKWAVEETLMSAAYYATRREDINCPIVQIAQGVNTKQYTECVRELLLYSKPYDYFGFGGFCILGKQRKLLPQFFETVSNVLPIIKEHNISRVHLYGVCLPEAIQPFHKLCTDYGIAWSTDSSAPEVAGLCFGRRYVGGRQKKAAGKKDVDYCPIDLAYYNVKEYYTWVQNLKSCPTAD